ncbi:unnamed protein product, partial [Allacma fusca]
ATLRSSRSSEILSEQTSEEKSTPSSTSTQFLFPQTQTQTSKKCHHHYGSGEFHSCSSTDEQNKPAKSESKIAKFLRRTQSANEDHCSSAVAATTTTTSTVSKNKKMYIVLHAFFPSEIGFHGDILLTEVDILQWNN